MKKNLILFMISLSLSSCGTYAFFNTSDFGKIKDLSELNGTYRNEDTPQTKAQSILRHFWGASENRLQMLQLIGCLECLDEDIDERV